MIVVGGKCVRLEMIKTSLSRGMLAAILGRE
jgi:hypothetical protein